MPSAMKLGSETTETSQDMGHVLRQERRPTQQQTLKAVKAKVAMPYTEKSSLSQDKHRVVHSFGQMYLERNCGSRLDEKSNEKLPRPKSSANHQRSQTACDDKELVRHMSNLPGFLQRVDKESNLQEKALNFGVLDWTRLEKWKYTEHMPLKYPKKTPSSSANGPPKMGSNLRKQPSSHSRNPSSLSSLYSGKQSMARFSSPQRQPPPPHSSLLNSSKEERNAHKEETHAEHIKSKGKETCNKDYRQAVECSTNSIGRQQDHIHHKVKFHDRSKSETNMYNSKRKDPKKEMVFENLEFSRPSSHKKIADAEGKKGEARLDDDVKYTSKCSEEPQNIVLLVPKHFPRTSCSENSHFTESRTSIDGQPAEVTGNRLSDFISPQELYSEVFSLDIPHSCPLPSVSMEPHSSMTSQELASDICTNAKSVNSTTSKGQCSQLPEETARPSSSVEASNEKQTAIAEQPTAKGRAPSPTRRFSFSLGKMGRSFSFKESAALPEPSSTSTAVDSGPNRSQVSSSMDNFEKDNGNATSRGRSSPLRRLLDPLLKHKGPLSAEKGNIPSKAPSQIRKSEASPIQALLQLTLKNGLPFFKLVVESSNEMLAAGVKKLPTSGKSDPCMIYAFYSVHEIRKKGMNWMNQASKSKNCSLGYNIVGQMTVSNHWDSSECVSRECVLFGVDPGQGDKLTLECVPNKEIAAVVIKNSILVTDENKNTNGTIVLLPGGVHGVPVKGAPSSLISRWRSGGSCDCGGWDVGCKLRILTNSEKNTTTRNDHVNLFVQGGDRNSKPVFSLKPCNNGFYSIELDASISLLEAFATCVSYVTCCKFPELIDTNRPPNAENFPESVTGTDKRKTRAIFQEQLPAKYVTCPPLSPVGRI